MQDITQRLETKLLGIFESQFYNSNAGENLEASIPLFSKIVVWITLGVPMLGFLSYWFLRRVIHTILVRLMVGFTSRMISMMTTINKQQQPPPSSSSSNYYFKLIYLKDKKRFIEFVLYTDVLCCAFCFGLYGVPLGDFTYLDSRLMREPDYSQLSILYKATTTYQTQDTLLLWNERELRSCCHDQKKYGFYRNVNDTLHTWLPNIRAILFGGGTYNTTAFEEILYGSTILELTQMYQILSHWEDDRIITEQDKDISVSSPIQQVSPVGMFIKDINQHYHSSEKQLQVCCVCYVTPIIYGWLTELFLVYGLILLLGILVVGKCTSIYTLSFYTVLSLVLPILSHVYVVALHYRDVYNLLVPSRTLSQVLQACVTVYSSVQHHYPAYFIVIFHATLKLIFIYMFMLVMSMRKELERRKKPHTM